MMHFLVYNNLVNRPLLQCNLANNSTRDNFNKYYYSTRPIRWDQICQFCTCFFLSHAEHTHTKGTHH